MKDLMKKIAIVLVLALTSYTASAAITPDVYINQTGTEKKISLELNKIQPGTQIRIRQINGPVLLKEVTVDTYYAKVFNLSKLAPGEYEMVIQTETRDIVQPITVTREDLHIDQNARKTYFAPVIRFEDSTLDVSYFRGAITSVTVTIYDLRGNVVFEEDFDHMIKMERRYDLEDLPKGKYSVRVFTDYRNYNKDIVIR